MSREERSVYRTEYDSPLGVLTLYSDGTALTALTMPRWRYQPPEGAAEAPELPVFGTARRWLDDYFAGRDPGALPPLAARGTPFQELVWEELRAVPYGGLTTYGAICRRLEERTGRRASAQAVGGAVGRNPLGILIPCHRCVGTDGSLTGFGGGLPAKRTLLKLEGHDPEHLHPVPARR